MLNRAERTKWEEKANEILDKIRPYIQHDGGDCELLELTKKASPMLHSLVPVQAV